MSADKVIAGLEDTRKRLWAAHGMVQMLKRADGGEPFGQLEIESFAEALEIILAPTYESIDNGIDALRCEDVTD